MRKALRAIGRGILLVVLAIWGERQAIAILASGALLGAGIWLLTSPGWALVAAGTLGLWVSLPERKPFLERRVRVWIDRTDDR